jgi:2-oxo-hept-3-ene-1,7-dioate hydratase
MISQQERQQAADALFEAGRNSKPIAQVSKTWPKMEIEDSYVVQQLWADQRVQAGARVIGHKIGLTSRAMQQAT